MLGLLIPDASTGKTLLGFDADHLARSRDARRRPVDRSVLGALVSYLRPAAVPVHAGPAGDVARSPTPVTAGCATRRGVRGPFRHHRQIALFLLARMLYADGLGAVFAFGGIYAASVFGWGASELGLFGIILTVAGTVGAALRRRCSTIASAPST